MQYRMSLTPGANQTRFAADNIEKPEATCCPFTQSKPLINVNFHVEHDLCQRGTLTQMRTSLVVIGPHIFIAGIQQTGLKISTRTAMNWRHHAEHARLPHDDGQIHSVPAGHQKNVCVESLKKLTFRQTSEKSDSSIRMSQARKVRTTRSCVGCCSCSDQTRSDGRSHRRESALKLL